MISQNQTLLGRMPPFDRLSPHALSEVFGLGDVRQLGAGRVVFDEAQPVERFYLLLCGHIRFVRLTHEGDQIIVLHVPAGQMFGIGVALDQAKHHVTAITADDCLVQSWPNALWPVFSASYDGFSAEALRTVGTRADEMSNRIVELSTKLVEQRIACALLRLISQSGRKVEGGIEIGFPITRQNIADMTGTTLHTVSRVLSDWERRMIVRSTRRLIVVTNPHRLMVVSTAGGVGETVKFDTSAKRSEPYVDAAKTAALSSDLKSASSRLYSKQASITV
jgi:CRP-like cAMP-binding protein